MEGPQWFDHDRTAAMEPLRIIGELNADYSPARDMADSIAAPSLRQPQPHENASPRAGGDLCPAYLGWNATISGIWLVLEPPAGPP
ncbi:hypothetical protein [Rhodococcus sp. JS3073]|uniref:hypothetical protein n=1 Tax=Rhodococcus sp. JS3073 TaxID=3002901 RepID=UPI0022869C5F|nr:hypothetical protein [Rhodococcus sp. JS3073]WAM19645.1 hypothetical protein OYT95_38960 [Rhodococcus sp. JS3073]